MMHMCCRVYETSIAFWMPMYWRKEEHWILDAHVLESETKGVGLYFGCTCDGERKNKQSIFKHIQKGIATVKCEKQHGLDEECTCAEVRIHTHVQNVTILTDCRGIRESTVYCTNILVSERMNIHRVAVCTYVTIICKTFTIQLASTTLQNIRTQPVNTQNIKLSPSI